MHAQAQIIMLLRKSRHYTEMFSMLFRDKICPLGMLAGKDSQLLTCSLQLLVSLFDLQHHSHAWRCTENSTVLHFHLSCWHSVIPVCTGSPF